MKNRYFVILTVLLVILSGLMIWQNTSLKEENQRLAQANQDFKTKNENDSRLIKALSDKDPCAGCEGLRKIASEKSDQAYKIYQSKETAARAQQEKEETPINDLFRSEEKIFRNAFREADDESYFEVALATYEQDYEKLRLLRKKSQAYSRHEESWMKAYKSHDEKKDKIREKIKELVAAAYKEYQAVYDQNMKEILKR